MFFKQKSVSFILWMSSLLKPHVLMDKQWIYLENEAVNEIYFQTLGVAHFVLPRYKNVPYIKILEGFNFGIIDIIGSIQSIGCEQADWYKNRSQLHRQFTVISESNCEVLIFSIQNLFQMQTEFPDYFTELFDSEVLRLKNAWIIKLQTLRRCNQIQ